MRVLNLRQEDSELGVRASADVVWEKAPRPQQTIFVEFGRELAGELELSGDAFLVGCLAPALKNGETRIRIEGSVCPRLRDGCAVAAALLRGWYGAPRGEIEIEAEDGFRPSPERRSGALSFLTGGVDSTFTLSRNHLSYGADHPLRIRECVLLSGLYSREADSRELAAEFDSRMRRAAGAIARSAGVELHIVRTNIRDLEPGFAFFARESHSSILAAVAQLLCRRVATAYLASSPDLRHLVPAGTHPLLDTAWSSCRMEIVHDGLGFDRIEKLREIAAWPAGLAQIMVCQAGPVEKGFINCGRCEKCCRTLLELSAIDRVDEAASFRSREVSPAAIFRGRIRPEGLYHWNDLVTAFENRRRYRLALAIRLKILVSLLFARRRTEDPNAYCRSGGSPGAAG